MALQKSVVHICCQRCHCQRLYHNQAGIILVPHLGQCDQGFKTYAFIKMSGLLIGSIVHRLAQRLHHGILAAFFQKEALRLFIQGFPDTHAVALRTHTADIDIPGMPVVHPDGKKSQTFALLVQGGPERKFLHL